MAGSWAKPIGVERLTIPATMQWAITEQEVAARLKEEVAAALDIQGNNSIDNAVL